MPGSVTTGALIVRGILALAVTGLVLSLIKRRGAASELAITGDIG